MNRKLARQRLMNLSVIGLILAISSMVVLIIIGLYWRKVLGLFTWHFYVFIFLLLANWGWGHFVDLQEKELEAYI